jgi:hypothetical protein
MNVLLATSLFLPGDKANILEELTHSLMRFLFGEKTAVRYYAAPDDRSNWDVMKFPSFESEDFVFQKCL